MSRRLDIELTSQRDESTWTWRAAGARQPKGEVRSELLPASAVVGSVLRAEAEDGLDGLEITVVTEPKVRADPTDRLELITASSAPGVTTMLAPKSRRRDRKDRGFDNDDDLDGFGDNRRRDRKRKQRRRDGDDAEDGSEGSKAKRRGRDRSDRSERGDRRDRRKPESRSASRATNKAESRSERRSDDRRSSKRSKDRSDRNVQHRSDHSPRSARPRGPGLKAKRVHRQAALKALPSDQQPLAREVLRGGVPAVRNSIERMNSKAVDAKLPQIKADPLLALAEQLAPVLKAAEWRDRAEAALAGIDNVDLREIRSVIAAADRAARSDETRTLAENLKDGFAKRLEADQRRWLDELAATIGEGRTIRALRLSSWPPKAGTPLPIDMAERLAGLAAADLSADTNQQRWSTVMDAVSFSPVRTQVIPAGIPEKPDEELLDLVRQLASRVPQIAALFGITAQTPAKTPKKINSPPSEATPSEAASLEAAQPDNLPSEQQSAETAEPTADSTAEPTAEPATDSAVDPVADSTAEPVVDGTVEPSTEP